MDRAALPNVPGPPGGVVLPEPIDLDPGLLALLVFPTAPDPCPSIRSVLATLLTPPRRRASATEWAYASARARGELSDALAEEALAARGGLGSARLPEAGVAEANSSRSRRRLS